MIPYIDMHCDTLMRAYVDGKENIYEWRSAMLDIKRLQEGGARAQFFAIFMLPESMRKELGQAYPEDLDYIKACLEIYRKNLKEESDIIAEAGSLKDYLENEENGRISGILSLEDGRAVNNKVENIQWLYKEGFRMIALTWNHENCFGYPNSGDAQIMQQGLKPFGKEAVSVMNDLGMIVDVSHLSDAGFWDVAKLTRKPFVASHSNCRAIAPHQRNLTDEMIRALAEKGGVMGLNFYGPFLNEDAKDKESRISQMIQHLKHMINVGGSDIPAIGTDFDGIDGRFELSDCSKMQLLFNAMEKAGFTYEQIEKIAFRNVERVLKESL